MKINSYLYLAVVLLVIAHLAYNAHSKVEPLEGNYFTSGIILPSDGKLLDYSIRLQANEENLYYFNRLSGYNMEFLMHFTSGLFGSARLISEGIAGKFSSKMLSTLDRDIAFNYAYIGKPKSKLSLYRLNIESGCKCYYIREISLPICPGVERVGAVK